MTLRIAIAGKGGVGKTTCSALLLRALALSGVRPLLAVDADPNANLHQLLSLPLPERLGSLREEQRAVPGGAVPLKDRIASEVERRLSEGVAVDLIAMGRGEGPGCYCYVNNLLREALDRIEGSYRAVVMDNEAGMEHLSRRSAAADRSSDPGGRPFPARYRSGGGPAGPGRGTRPACRENVAPPEPPVRGLRPVGTR